MYTCIHQYTYMCTYKFLVTAVICCHSRPHTRMPFVTHEAHSHSDGIDTLPHTRAPCVTHEAPSSSDGIETLKIDQLNAQWIKADLTQERHVSHMKRSHVRLASLTHPRPNN